MSTQDEHDNVDRAPSSAPSPDSGFMTDEQRYGRDILCASRWRRVVDWLDDNVPGWRAPGPHHTDVNASRFIGDYAHIALDRLKVGKDALASQVKATTELADKYHALKNSLGGSSFNALSYQLTRANDKVRALEEELAMSRKAISALDTQRSCLRAELEAARCRGQAHARFRLSKDKRWEGSYTKRVVDELKEHFPHLFHRDCRTPSKYGQSIVAAAELLEDYHTTQHEVWERAERLEKDATAQYGSENWRRFGAPRDSMQQVARALMAVKFTAADRPTPGLTPSSCQQYERAVGMVPEMAAPYGNSPQTAPKPTLGDLVAEAAKAQRKMETALGSPPTAGLAIAEYVHAAIRWRLVKERQEPKA